MLDRLKSDGWVPYTKFGGTLAVAAVALAVSAVQLVDLADRVKIDPTLQWTLPTTLDVGGGVATIVWTKGVGPVRTWAMCVAILSLLESVAGNILSHLIEADIIKVSGLTGVLLIIGVGAVYPLNLSMMVHLLVTSSPAKAARPPRHVARPESRRAEAVREPVKPEQPAVAATNTRKPIETAPPKVVAIGDAGSKREQGRAWFHEQVLTHGRAPHDITAREVDAAIQANGYAKKHIQGWRDEVLAATKTGTAVAGN